MADQPLSVKRTIDQWEDDGVVHRMQEDEDGHLSVQYRSPLFGGSWQHIGSDAGLYRLREVLGERLSGGEQECSRIRRELLAAITDWTQTVKPAECQEREVGANAALAAVLNALDRILPEEG